MASSASPDPLTQLKRRRSPRIAPCCHGHVPDGSFLSNMCEHPAFHSSVTHRGTRSQTIKPGPLTVISQVMMASGLRRGIRWLWRKHAGRLGSG